LTSLRELLSAPRYEVIPAKGTEQAVADWMPAGMTVAVTHGWRLQILNVIPGARGSSPQFQITSL